MKKYLKYIICGSIALTVIIVDMISKILAVTLLKEGNPVPVLGEFLKLDLCFNTGIAFGGFQELNSPILLGGVSLVMSVVIGFLIFKYGDIKNKKIGTIALALMLGGALGNMVDRFFNFPACLYVEDVKGVVDFVNTNHIVELISNGRFTWGVWNIADAMLCVGTGMLMVHLVFFEKDEKKTKQQTEQETIETEEVTEFDENQTEQEND